MYWYLSRARSGSRSAATRCFRRCCVLLLVVCCFPAREAASAHSQPPAELSETTEYRVLSQNWWPRKGTASSGAYAGASACRQCHADEASTQPRTPMANASYHSAVSNWGAKLSAATGSSGPYFYRVVPHAHEANLIVSSGNQSITADITWTFGAGVRGQTFILENNGTTYDSQVSSFPGLHDGMAITPGHPPAKAGDLHKALGARLDPQMAARCFGCHTTNSTMNDQFDPQQAIPGIQCESCHGPGLAHVVAANMNLVEDAKALIFSPHSLSPVESVDFCGACHMTPADVAESDFFGPNNVRFQPYRLEKSRCWGVRGDERLVCSACHNPHQPVAHEARFYDQRCLGCHRSSDAQAQNQGASAPGICPKATANCTTCHMPKYDVPEMHAKFTDHFIRIVRPGEAYPAR